ncbi:hypothetical protein FDUTEX481_08586 [Tolypothrix sp. PCC 7601]|nr:hypothetical protein FDUTEX481_08586 [Tolypothrix sp. PCC 7601]
MLKRCNYSLVKVPAILAYPPGFSPPLRLAKHQAVKFIIMIKLLTNLV